MDKEYDKSKKVSINQKAFGQRLQKQRIKLGYTQKELAEITGMSPNFLSDLETGKKLPSLENLLTLSSKLKMSIDSMFSDSLDISISEPEEIYYTDRQLHIMNSVIKKITDNF